MKNNQVYLEEVCDFLKHFGYPDAQPVDSYSADIEVPSQGINIQVFDGGWDDKEEAVLFLGSEYPEGFDWRLLKADYALFVTPYRYHLVDTASLLEFILNNEFHKKNKVKTRKRSESIVVRVRMPWIVYGLQPDIKTFSRPDYSDEEKLYKEFEELCPDCGYP